MWRLLPYAVTTPAQNMAIDEAVFHNYLDGLAPPTLRFYGWSPPALSIGYFQELANEVDLDNLAAKGFGLVRRPTGGRAVLHHHELTYSIVAGVKEGLPNNLIESYGYISQALVHAFANFGVLAELHQKTTAKNSASGACFESPSWYELKVANRKLVGSAQLRRNGSFLQHGSILLNFSALDLGAVLKVPQGVSIDEFVGRLRQKVTSFRDLGVNVAPFTLAKVIVESFINLYHLQFMESPLLEAEEKLVQELITSKYANHDWNYKRGHSCSRRGESSLKATPVPL